MGFLIKILSDQICQLWSSDHHYYFHGLLHTLCPFLMIISIAAVYHFFKPRTSVYLLDYSCFKPPSSYRFPNATFVENMSLNHVHDPDIVDFQSRIVHRSGLGDETCTAPANLFIPPAPTLEASILEAELIVFTVIDDLFQKTGIPSVEIDFLIVNCGVVSPTPSLSAMVINKYKFRSDVKSFNLSGMGCSASLISIDLARNLLEVHPNSRALVVSTEITTPNYYGGNDRSMVLTNCLFRIGGAAMILSNRAPDVARSKYRLLHLIRTHNGADDEAHRCVHEREDPQGIRGVSLSKNLTAIAGEALRVNMTAVGPLVLPASEQLIFLAVVIVRRILKLKRININPHVPDFKKGVGHLCIHAGGRGVIDEMQRKLKLSEEDVEASRMTLHRFGNVSSSSIWYEMRYIESKGRMKEGDRVWQIALGSGFKCNSAVWKCNRAIPAATDGPWLDCIHRYPASSVGQLPDL